MLLGPVASDPVASRQITALAAGVHPSGATAGPTARASLPERRAAVQAAVHRTGRPHDREAPTRAESEKAARRGWDETPRARLRHEVSVAAGGHARNKSFHPRLERAGWLCASGSALS